MPDNSDQNLSRLNQENINPDAQKQAGRVLVQSSLNQAPVATQSPDFKATQPMVAKMSENIKNAGEQKAAKTALNQAQQKAEKPVALVDKAVGKIGAGTQASVKALIGFSYPVWIAAIILAGVYDLYNICALELLSEFDWIADIIMGGGITILLWTQGSKARQAKKIIEQIVTTAAEIIPGVGLLPLWLIMVLWQFYKAYNEHEAEELQKVMGAKSQPQSQTAEEFAS